MLTACKGNKHIVEDGYVVSYEVLYRETVDSINSLTGEVQVLKDSIDYLNDDILIQKMRIVALENKYQSLSDSIDVYKEDAFVYKYKIERIKAYDNIVRNNSSQSKYFLGWVRRVLED